MASLYASRDVWLFSRINWNSMALEAGPEIFYWQMLQRNAEWASLYSWSWDIDNHCAQWVLTAADAFAQFQDANWELRRNGGELQGPFFFFLKLHHFLLTLLFKFQAHTSNYNQWSTQTTPVAPVAKSDRDRHRANHDGRLSAPELMSS